MDHSLIVIKKIFDKYPKAQEMPVDVDYALGMLIRNMLIWACFRYIHPTDIQIDYLDLLITKGSFIFMETFLCPCGGTLLNFSLHW